jgi:hypothetical protein
MTTLEVLNERPFELYITDLFHSVALAISPNIVLSAAFVPTLGAACKQDNLRLTGAIEVKRRLAVTRVKLLLKA